MTIKINILNFDIFAKRATFFFNNQEKIGSFFGLFLTLLYAVASIILFIYHVIITIRRQEIRVYDSTLYAQEMPIIELDKENFNFAFGLEDPITLNRFVDETIYIPEVAFIDRVKINGDFVTQSNRILPLEKCKHENFGDNYKHLLLEGELSNSYCLKDYNYNLTFAGGFKYERMSYLRIKIYPCKNGTNNNYTCKSQETIDHYFTSGYFSILLKDIGLNPSNYSNPIIPTLQDLYTTIDRRLNKNYILNFGLTEVHTDIGLINEQIKEDKHIQYRKEIQTSTFSDEALYLSGNNIILVQIRLDDTVLIQKRTYTKIPDILSRIGGYMQLMYTVLLLVAISINKIDCQLKIINSIFNFNLQQNKMVLKLQSLKTLNRMSISKRKIFIPINNKLRNARTLIYDNNKSSNLLIKSNNTNNVISSSGNLPEAINIYKYKNSKVRNPTNSLEEHKNKSISSKFNLKINEGNNFNLNIQSINNQNKSKSNNLITIENSFYKDNYNYVKLSIFGYIFPFGNKKKKKMVELYHFGNDFYKKRMDIVLVFSHLLLTEKVLISNNLQHKNAFCKDIEILYPKE